MAILKHEIVGLSLDECELEDALTLTPVHLQLLHYYRHPQDRGALVLVLLLPVAAGNALDDQTLRL